MRIVIEMDGIEPRGLAGSEESAPVQRESAPVDGGSGPGEGAAFSVGLEMDSGGPPQSLLDEIAAAEAAETQGASGEVGAADAGSGPSGQ
jgi:hypothetical protein